MEDAPLGYSLDDLHMRINMLHHLQKSYLRPKAAALSLGPGQPRILSYLAVHGPSTQRDIAAYYHVDAAAVSRMVDIMLKNGFVELVAGEDRRTKVVQLTRTGCKALASWDAACRAFDELAYSAFTPQERKVFDELHHRMAHAVEEGLSQPGAPDAADSVGALRDGEAPHA